MFDDGEPTNLDDGTCLTVCINCMGLSKYTSAGLVKVTMEEYEAFPAETKEELSRLKGVLFLTRVKDPRDFVAEQRRNASQQ